MLSPEALYPGVRGVVQVLGLVRAGAGAGYAGLHVALRLDPWVRVRKRAHVTLVDRHPYHQVITELPRVAAGTRSVSTVQIPLDHHLTRRTHVVQAEITGFDLSTRQLLTSSGPLAYTHLVIALGSQPND